MVLVPVQKAEASFVKIQLSHPLSIRSTLVFWLVLLISQTQGGLEAKATGPSTVVGDLGSPQGGINFGNPGYGYAQEFTISSGLWTISQAWISLGDSATMPGPPLFQVRNTLGSSVGPGATVLGSFILNPNDIPTGFNFANILAPANSPFMLGPGTYWLCIGNNQPVGGFWVPMATDNTLVQGGIAGIINTTAVALSSNGGQTFSPPSLGGWALITQLDGTQVPEPQVWALLAVGCVCFRLGRTPRSKSFGLL
ncbi:MAG: hypothetical protein C5B50_22605 [Verrucomicrobia bacterium]|nr:MAG: hypothetical protein C5B50_22605 [Verrucomicrobiota bacterium]